MSAAPVRVVTLAREYGSGGAAVAAELAQRLGFQLLDRALIVRLAASCGTDAAVVSQLDERVDSFMHRLSRSLWRGAFEAVAPVDDSAVLDSDQLAARARRLIEEAAELGGCVVVGRGGQCALARRDDTLHVFVYARREARARRLRERLGPGADLEAAMDGVDRERAACVRRHFDAEWSDRGLYDLMLNSSLGEGAVVAALVAAIAARAEGKSPTR
jgi:cytidylate kinase